MTTGTVEFKGTPRQSQGFTQLNSFKNMQGKNSMKKILAVLFAFIVGSALTVSSALASPASDELGTCLADNTTGKDRKELARWIFVAMSSHPELHKFINITAQERDEENKKLAAMVTKLMTESCRAQTKIVLEKDGQEGFKSAFAVIGQLAMQELMSNPEVSSSFTEYAKYLDKSKFNSAFEKK